jgi:hypothetical protein
MNGPVEMARKAWGTKIPAWVLRLAQECAATSQRRVAEQLDRSGALVNQVLKAKYPGDLGAVEDMVRGVFMNGTIDCPALGELRLNLCHGWRAKSRNFGSANSQRVRMFRACNRCNHNKKEGAR